MRPLQNHCNSTIVLKGEKYFCHILGPIFDPQIDDLTDQDQDRWKFLDTKNIRIAIEKVAVLKNDGIVIAQMVSLIATGIIVTINKL